MDKYNRSNFYKTVTIKNQLENDFLTNALSRFEFKRPRTNYTIKFEDIGRPDIISQNLFGTTVFWWILMKLNNIEDIWNDLHEMLILTVPNRLDIEEFYLNNKKRNI